MTKLTRDMVLQAAEGRGFQINTTTAFLVIQRRNTNYVLEIGNSDPIGLINIIGFNPPAKIKGFKKMGKEYGRILHRVDMELPGPYLVDAIRCLFHCMVGLPKNVGDVPTCKVDAETIRVLEQKAKYEMTMQGYNRRDGIVRPRQRIMTPMEGQYIASAEEYAFEKQHKTPTKPEVTTHEIDAGRAPTVLITPYPTEKQKALLKERDNTPVMTMVGKKRFAAPAAEDDTYELIELIPAGHNDE